MRFSTPFVLLLSLPRSYSVYNSPLALVIKYKGKVKVDINKFNRLGAFQQMNNTRFGILLAWRSFLVKNQRRLSSVSINFDERWSGTSCIYVDLEGRNVNIKSMVWVRRYFQLLQHCYNDITIAITLLLDLMMTGNSNYRIRTSILSVTSRVPHAPGNAITVVNIIKAISLE